MRRISSLRFAAIAAMLLVCSVSALHANPITNPIKKPRPAVATKHTTSASSKKQAMPVPTDPPGTCCTRITDYCNGSGGMYYCISTYIPTPWQCTPSCPASCYWIHIRNLTAQTGFAGCCIDTIELAITANTSVCNPVKNWGSLTTCTNCFPTKWNTYLVDYAPGGAITKTLYSTPSCIQPPFTSGHTYSIQFAPPSGTGCDDKTYDICDANHFAVGVCTDGQIDIRIYTTDGRMPPQKGWCSWITSFDQEATSTPCYDCDVHTCN